MTKTMTISELSGAALDWAVAKCEGYQSVYTNGSLRPVFRKNEAVKATWPNYSTDWSQGGPIIEREMIELVPQSPTLWDAMYRTQHIPNDGPTPLIAAMRCYVASKLGGTVKIPLELINNV